MFIRTMHDRLEKIVQEEGDPMFREENIAWPSESSAVVADGITVGECGRSLFYKILGQKYTEDKSMRLRTICDAGLMYENSFIEQTKKIPGMYLTEQSRIGFVIPESTNAVKVSGKADLIVNDNGKIVMIEIKTVAGYKADSIFGDKSGAPLPAANNLMQAMLYKHKANTELIDGLKVEEVYLAYINRGDGSTMFFKIDIDSEGFAIITPVQSNGIVLPTIHTVQIESFDDLLNKSTTASSINARYAECRININNIFKKFDDIYTYARSSILPPKDFSLVYTNEEIEKAYKCGRFSKIKYNLYTKGKEVCSDMKCSWCSYKTKCLADDGIKLR